MAGLALLLTARAGAGFVRLLLLLGFVGRKALAWVARAERSFSRSAFRSLISSWLATLPFSRDILRRRIVAESLISTRIRDLVGVVGCME